MRYLTHSRDTRALSIELVAFQQALRALAAEFPNIDESELLDTVEGSTNLADALGAVARAYLDDCALGKALRERIDTMTARLRRLEARAARLKTSVSLTMAEAGLRRLHFDDLTLSLRRENAPLLVDDETGIPAEFWRPQAPKLDRLALGQALRAGRVVPGAILGNPGHSLSVRTA